AQVIGNAGPNNAPPDNDDVCCMCHASHTSLPTPFTVPLDTTSTRHEVLLYMSPLARCQAPSQNTRRAQIRYNRAESRGPSAIRQPTIRGAGEWLFVQPSWERMAWLPPSITCRPS